MKNQPEKGSDSNGTNYENHEQQMQYGNMVIKFKSNNVAPDTSLPVTPHLPLSAVGVKFAGLVSSCCWVLIIWVALVSFAFDAVERR